MFRRLRVCLARMFLPELYTPEGFRLSNRQYVGPQDTIELPATQKMIIAICNLFANQNKRIDEIAKLLDTDRRAVLLVLIQEGLILDRRHSQTHQRTPNRR